MSASAAADRYDPETIKRERPISDVVMNCGIQVHPSGPHTYKALCPFHPDRHPSLLLDKRDNHYHCFACRAHGDTIDFVMARLGVSFAEACEHLARLAVPAPDSSTRRLAAVPRAAGARASSEGDGKQPPADRRWDRLDLEEQMAMNTAHAVYKHLLWRTPRALEYLRRRGIPDWVIRECGLGYADGRTLETYLRRRHGLQTAQRLGLLRRPGRQDGSPHLRELLSSRVVVPELRGGQCIWMIGRALSDSPHVPRYLALPGERPVLGWERAAGREEAYLCEGVIDWLTAVAWKLPAFSTCGTSLPDERLGFLARARTVYGLLDGDDAGRAAAERFGRQLGVRWRPIELPEGQDLNDLGAQPGGRERFLALLAAARGDREATHDDR